MPLTLPSSREVEAALAEVFARPEFAPPPPSPLGDWLRGAWARVRDFFGDLFGAVGVPEGGGRLLGWLAVALLAAAALAFGFHLTGAAGRVWRRRERASRPRPIPAPAEMRAPDWEERARRAAAEGRWRDAALALYSALLLRLDARGALRFDAAKTPGDYRREARRDAEAVQLLEGFLRRFEPAAFGGRPLDAAEYARLRDAAAAAGAHG